MFAPAHNTNAHTLAIASAATPLVGIRFDDIKWAISLLVSVFGSLIALYIVRVNMRMQAEAVARYEAAERRREAARPVMPLRKPGDVRGDVAWLDD
jgi:hypothetical protein